jgi:hypothetical protein
LVAFTYNQTQRHLSNMFKEFTSAVALTSQLPELLLIKRYKIFH